MKPNKIKQIQSILFLTCGLFCLSAGQMFAELDGSHDVEFNLTSIIGLAMLFASYVYYPFQNQTS